MKFFTYQRVFLLLALISTLASTVQSPIKYVIVIVMENRSFDHLLGFLHLDNPEVDGLTGNETNLYNVNDPHGKYEQVNQKGYDISPSDPGHGYHDQVEQIFGLKSIDPNKVNHPKMNGFVWNAINKNDVPYNPMSMFNKSTAPIINKLASEFAVFDQWHCSVPGPTDPNRAYIMGGTSRGVLHNYDGNLWPQKSYFQFLTENKVSWGAYYQDDPWAIVYFKDIHEPKNVKNVHHLDKFFTDVKKGELKQFTFLQPRMTTAGGPPTWQHPSSSVQEGERLLKQIYETLRNSKYWKDCAFLITYDEHGGFYDHVPPPQNGIPNPDGINNEKFGFKFDRLGIRVPTVLVSPWVAKGSVIHQPTMKPNATSSFEGTSIIATVSKIFGITAEPLTKRVAWAGTFEDKFSLSAPRTDCLKKLPYVPSTHPDTIEKVKNSELSDHLEIQVNFYCKMNGHGKHCHHKNFNNTHAASIFVEREAELFMNRLKSETEESL